MKQLIKDVLVKNRHDLAKAYADDLDIDAEFDSIAGEIEQALQQCGVSGSLELLAQLLSREMAKMDNAKTTDDIDKARMNMNAILLVQELISKSFASDR